MDEPTARIFPYLSRASCLLHWLTGMKLHHELEPNKSLNSGGPIDMITAVNDARFWLYVIAGQVALIFGCALGGKSENI
jgi:hypothetical protein